MCLIIICTASQGTNAKKIKTESGVWISASYKSDRYKAWMRKSKVEHQENDDDDDNDASDNDSFARNGSKNNLKRKPAFSKKLVKSGKNEAPRAQIPKGKRFKSELKRPEQILKERKAREKKMQKNLPKNIRKKRQKEGGSKHKSHFGKRK